MAEDWEKGSDAKDTLDGETAEALLKAVREALRREKTSDNKHTSGNSFRDTIWCRDSCDSELSLRTEEANKAFFEQRTKAIAINRQSRLVFDPQQSINEFPHTEVETPSEKAFISRTEEDLSENSSYREEQTGESTSLSFNTPSAEAPCTADRREKLFRRIACGTASDYQKLEFLLLPYFNDIPSELAKELLLQFGSLRSVLLSSPTELSAIPGVPPLAALSVPQYVPLLYGGEDASSPSSLNGIRVDSPDKAAKIFRKILGYGKTEKFYALHLDKHMRILAVERVADGGSSRVAVSISRLVSSAILSGAKYVILSHNHPNNADFASAADVSVTKSISDACYIVGIKLLDHIIMAGLAPDAYCSLARSDARLDGYFDIVDGYKYTIPRGF